MEQTKQEMPKHTKIALESIGRARAKLGVDYLSRVTDGSGHGDNFRNIHIDFVDANDEEREALYSIVGATSSSGEDFVYVARDKKSMRRYHRCMLKGFGVSRISFHYGNKSEKKKENNKGLMEVVFAN